MPLDVGQIWGRCGERGSSTHLVATCSPTIIAIKSHDWKLGVQVQWAGGAGLIMSFFFFFCRGVSPITECKSRIEFIVAFFFEKDAATRTRTRCCCFLRAAFPPISPCRLHRNNHRCCSIFKVEGFNAVYF